MFKHRSPIAEILALGANRVSPADVAQRLAERDQREAADTRTPAQVWLNEPPPGRSALRTSRLRDDSPSRENNPVSSPGGPERLKFLLG